MSIGPPLLGHELEPLELAVEARRVRLEQPAGSERLEALVEHRDRAIVGGSQLTVSAWVDRKVCRIWHTGVRQRDQV